MLLGRHGPHRDQPRRIGRPPDAAFVVVVPCAVGRQGKFFAGLPVAEEEVELADKGGPLELRGLVRPPRTAAAPPAAGRIVSSLALPRQLEFLDLRQRAVSQRELPELPFRGKSN